MKLLDNLFKRGKLPTFLILGTQKGGTSSLHNYLAQHPEIFMSTPKELHFFDLFYGYGLAWYKSHFKAAKKEHAQRGESSPYYLFHPGVPALVKKHLPQAKFIVLLREPVERAYSHFAMERNRGEEPESDFETALLLEKSRLLDAATFLENNPESSNKAHQTYSYASRGFYAEQIERWFEYFPKQQFLFLKSEDFFENPKTALAKVYSFLAIEDIYPTKLKAENKGDYEALNPELKEKVKSLFAEDQSRLQSLLGDEFVW